MTSHDEGPRTSKPSFSFEEPDNRILRGYCEAKGFGNPGPFHIKPRPKPRRKKCLRMNKEGPNCQETSPRTILPSVNQGHGRRKQHALKDSLPGRPKQKRLTQWASHGSMVKEQFQERLSPPH